LTPDFFQQSQQFFVIVKIIAYGRGYEYRDPFSLFQSVKKFIGIVKIVSRPMVADPYAFPALYTSGRIDEYFILPVNYFCIVGIHRAFCDTFVATHTFLLVGFND